MSRIGKSPISLPSGTQARIENNFIIVKGSKGELKQELHSAVDINIAEKEITVTCKNATDKKSRSLWGLYRKLIDNMVIGVNSGFEKKLEFKGVGYRAQAAGQKIVLNLGFSHPIDFALPTGITAVTEGNFITISGIDKKLVGEIASQIRRLRLPEPYKGKGIKYVDEVIRRKAGKTAASK